MIFRIKDAIVGILVANAAVSAWATGGIHVRRAPGLSQQRRDRYVVIRILESNPEHQQEGASELTTDRLEVVVVASSSRDADEGARLVRRALDGVTTDQFADLFIQRIFWRGTIDKEVEDASGAEQLMDIAVLSFDVSYSLAAARGGSGGVIVPVPFTANLFCNRDAAIEGFSSRQSSMNGSSIALLVGNNSNQTNPLRTLLNFDLDSLPATPTITTATLNLYASGGGSTEALAAKIHLLSEFGWFEFETNWLNYSTLNPWATPGADFLTGQSYDVDWNLPLVGGAFSITGLAAMTQYAYDNRNQQMGIILKIVDEAQTLNTNFITMRSIQYPDSTFWPQLAITGTTPG